MLCPPLLPSSPHTKHQGRGGATSPELITDLEALQSISQEAQRRASSPLFYPERVTDYPTSSHSLVNLRLSQSPMSHQWPTSVSPESHYSSNSTLNRSDSLSAVSETSGTSNTSKPAQKRILKKSNGPRRLSTNHVRWNLDGVERSDEGDSTSMDSMEAGWSGDPYRQAKEKFQRSRSAWKDFETPPTAGSTGLTPAPPRVAQQKTMFLPDGIPLSPIHREAPVRFPGYYELDPQATTNVGTSDPQATTNMGTSHSTPLRNAGVQELYEDKEMGTSEDNTQASETMAAGYSILKINDSSLASLEVTRADERLGNCLFEFPKETPCISAPIAPTTTPSAATNPPPPLPMATSSPAIGLIHKAISLAPAVQGPPLTSAVQGPPLTSAVQGPPLTPAIQGPPLIPAVQGPPLIPAVQGPPLIPAIQGPRLIPAIQGPPLMRRGTANPGGDKSGVMGTIGAIGAGVTSAGVTTGPARVLLQTPLDDDADYDHLEEKTSNRPWRAPNGTSNPRKTSGTENALSMVLSGSPEPSNGLLRCPNTHATSGIPSLLTTSTGSSLLNVPKIEQANVQSSRPEQSNVIPGYSQSDIEEAIEVLEHGMSALDIPLTTPPLATPTLPPTGAAQGFHSASEITKVASEITKVWSSTFPEPQSAKSIAETNQIMDQSSPTHCPQANQSPSPPPLPTKNRRISRSERNDQGNLLPNTARKGEEAVELNQWPEPAVMEPIHSKYLPPITEISSLTPPEDDGRELILPPPSEFLDIPPQSIENDSDDYFDLLEPNTSKQQNTTSSPLKGVALGRPSLLVDSPPALGSSVTQEEYSTMRDGLLGGGPLQKGVPLYRENPLIGAHHDSHPVQRVQSSRVVSTSSKLNDQEREGSSHMLSVQAGRGKLTATRALHMSDSESSLSDALRAAKGRQGGAPIGAQHTKPYQANNSCVDQKQLSNQLERPLQADRHLKRTTFHQVPMHSSSQPLLHLSTQVSFQSSTQVPFQSSTQMPFQSSTQAPLHSSSQPLVYPSTQVPFHSSSQPLAHPVPLLNSKFNPMRHQGQSNVTSVDSLITELERDCKRTLQETRPQSICGKYN